MQIMYQSYFIIMQNQSYRFNKMKISRTNSQIVLKLLTPSLAEVSGDYDYVLKSDSSVIFAKQKYSYNRRSN